MRTRLARRSTMIAVGLALLCVACVTASLARGVGPQYRLAVAITGDGAVRSDEGVIVCGSRCAHRYRRQRLVTLKATPAEGSRFVQWEGGCIGIVDKCVIAVERATSVRAVFVALGGLSVTVGGDGGVASRPAGILCPGPSVWSCGSEFDQGENVELFAVAAPGNAFARWGGACAAQPTAACDVRIGEATLVSATFRAGVPTPGMQTLTVAEGVDIPILSVPPGIACPGTCSASFASGTVVTLTKSGGAWGGACAGFGPCTVVVDHPTVVGAGSPGFSGPSPDLGVNVSVSGHGHVEATGGIRCGYRTGLARSCQAFFREGASVKLRAVPAKRARFLRWESFCQGTRLTCRLQVTATKSVIAVFGRR